MARQLLEFFALLLCHLLADLDAALHFLVELLEGFRAFVQEGHKRRHLLEVEGVIDSRRIDPLFPERLGAILFYPDVGACETSLWCGLVPEISAPVLFRSRALHRGLPLVDQTGLGGRAFRFPLGLLVLLFEFFGGVRLDFSGCIPKFLLPRSEELDQASDRFLLNLDLLRATIA